MSGLNIKAIYANKINALFQAGNYPAAYEMIGTMLTFHPEFSNSGRVSGWFHTAADVNRASTTFQKELVWKVNSNASIFSGGRALTNSENQRISDDLAREAIGYVLIQLANNKLILAEHIKNTDIDAAVKGIGRITGATIPQTLWTGGIFSWIYGFDVFAFGSDTQGIFQNTAQMADAFQVFKTSFRQTLRNLSFSAGSTADAITDFLQDGADSGVFLSSINYIVHNFDKIPQSAQSLVYNFLSDLRLIIGEEAGAIAQIFFDVSTDLDQLDNRATLRRSSLLESGIYTRSGNAIVLQNIRYIDQPDHSQFRRGMVYIQDVETGENTLLPGQNFSSKKNENEIVITSQSRLSGNGSIGSDYTNVSLKSEEFGDFIHLTGATVGSVFGSTLGRSLFINDPLSSNISSTLFSVVGQNIGQEIDLKLGLPLGEFENGKIKEAFSDLHIDLLSAGLGAIGSVLFAELVRAIGVGGFGAEALNSTGGAIIGQIASNIASGSSIFSGVTNPVLLLNAFGSLLGSKLGSLVVSFDTIGGQIGASLGSAVVSTVIASAFTTAATAVAAGTATGLASTIGSLGWAAGPVGALVGAFIGYIVGGLIGSLFGGTPRASAEVVWDGEQGRFEVANAQSRKNGSKDAAIGIAGNVAEAYNGVLSAVGGKLLAAEGVQAGNYGLRKKNDWTYRDVRDPSILDGSIDAKFTSADQLINHGLFIGLSDITERLAGGDVYIKRAVAATLLQANGSRSARQRGGFEVQTLLGNVSTAQDYASYLQNTGLVTVLCRSPISLRHLGLECERANAAQI
jgi:hypothetical protein